MGTFGQLVARDAGDRELVAALDIEAAGWLAELLEAAARIDDGTRRRGLWRLVAAALDTKEQWYRVAPHVIAAELAVHDAPAAAELASQWHARAAQRFGSASVEAVTAALQLVEVRANLGIHDPRGCAVAFELAPTAALRKRASLDEGCALMALGETREAIAVWRDADSDVVAVPAAAVLHRPDETPRDALVTALRAALREDVAPHVWGIGDAGFVRVLHALATTCAGAEATILDEDVTRRCGAGLFASEAEGHADAAIASLGGVLEVAGRAYDLAPLQARGERILAAQRLADY